jgi:hypothetical protein
LYFIIRLDNHPSFLCVARQLADEFLPVEDTSDTRRSLGNVMMFSYRDFRVQDCVKNALFSWFPLYPFAFNRMCLPASSPLMVVSDVFIFFMDNNLDVWVMVFYRVCRAQASEACANNINLDESHQPYIKEFLPTIYSFFRNGRK